MTTAKTLCRGLLHSILVVAFVGGASFEPVRAQETLQVTATAELRSLLGQAESLLASGDAAGAYTLLAPREIELAGHAYFDYLLGVAALDSGRTAEAILSLQRSVASAAQFAGARMELARAYYDSGRPNLARPLFEALLNERPPPGVRDVIDKYLAAIDAGPKVPPSQLQGYAELFAGYDNNANGSTDNQQFLGFTLSPENLETDSSFFEIGAGLDWLKPTSATFAWHVGARAGYRKNPVASFVDSGLLSATSPPAPGGRWRGRPRRCAGPCLPPKRRRRWCAGCCSFPLPFPARGGFEPRPPLEPQWLTVVEAAGVEPDHPHSTNWLMARDFRSNRLTTRCLLP